MKIKENNIFPPLIKLLFIRQRSVDEKLPREIEIQRCEAEVTTWRRKGVNIVNETRYIIHLFLIKSLLSHKDRQTKHYQVRLKEHRTPDKGKYTQQENKKSITFFFFSNLTKNGREKFML